MTLHALVSVPPTASRRSAFTLLELILSVTVLVVIMAILLQVVTSVQTTWRRGADAAATSETAQRTLDLLAADLSAAFAGNLPGSGLEAGTDSDSPLVFALFAEKEESSEVGLEGEAEEDDGFSRLLFTCTASRPVWNGGAAECSSTPVPSRKESDSRLRSVFGVEYSVIADEEAEAERAGDGEAEAPSPLRYSLVRKISGLKPHSNEDFHWWEDLDTLSGELIARNVVWFTVTVPSFATSSTNETGSANAEYESYTAYATRTDPSLQDLGLPTGGDLETGPLPALVDIVLGLVPERDMQQVEAIPDSEERNKRLVQRMRVYTRRVKLPAFAR